MDYFMSTHYLEKRGNLKGFDDNAKEEFVRTMYSSYFIYDPYKDIFYNPFFNKRHFPKFLQKQNPNELKIFLQENYHLKMTDELFERVKNKLGKLHSQSYILHQVFSKLKWVGLLLGTAIAIFYNFYLGLSVGLYLIYLDIGYFHDRNNVLSFIENNFSAALTWVKNKTLYLFSSILLMLLTLTSIFLYSKSFLVPILFYIFHWLWFSSFIRTSLSYSYLGTQGIMDIETIKGRNN